MVESESYNSSGIIYVFAQWLILSTLQSFSQGFFSLDLQEDIFL